MPVLAALNGEGAAVIQEAKAGLTCRAGDANGLAEIVIKMSKMSMRDREIMGTNGFEFSKREFDRKITIDMAEAHLMRLIA